MKHKLNSGQRVVPLLEGILPINSSALSGELMAGITLAALAIPEVIGYTKISGTPLITGLYTLLIPMILFAFFGSSRHLVVAADSATAAILAAALVGVAPSGTSAYTALAGLLALMAAGLLILARLIGLGFMADFLSRTVLIGFLTGVGIQIAIGQIPGMLGLSQGLGLGHINFYDVLFSLLVIGIITGSKKISKKLPGPLMAVMASIMAGYIVNFDAYGVHTLGTIPQGLPALRLPDVHWSFALIQKLLPAAFSMFVVILAQSAATSRAYAARYGDPFNENTDLMALGLANIGAAISGTFVVNGSPTKTQMVDSAGGRSQLSQIITSLIVVLVLIFFTAPLSRLPNVVLSAVVFLIGIQLIDLRGMVTIRRERPPEFWVALVTALVVVLVGVEQGIIIAMVISLMEHVRHSYRSQNVILSPEKNTGAWRLLPINAPQEAQPGLLIYRFAHTIYYANAPQLFDQVMKLTQQADPPLSCLCIDASAIADVDFTGGETLREIYGLLKAKGIRLWWTNVTDSVKVQLEKYGLIALMGQDSFFENISTMMASYSPSLIR